MVFRRVLNKGVNISQEFKEIVETQTSPILKAFQRSLKSLCKSSKNESFQDSETIPTCRSLEVL
jgi:hypothetical protein